MGPQAALPATYLALAIVLSGCFSAQPKDVPIDDAPEAPDPTGPLKARFTYAPVIIKPGDLVQFTDASDGPVEDRAWDFGDNTASNERDPTHEYATVGSYRVTLRIKDASGEAAVTTQVVPVRVPGQPVPTGSPEDPITPAGFLAFAAPSTVVGSNGGEPSLATDSKGNFYVSPPGDLLKSADGKSWARLDYPLIVSGDSHVLVDKDDRVYISDLQGGGLGPGIGILGPSSVWASADAGNTWTKGNPMASIVPLNDRQWVASPGGNVVYLLYRVCTVYTPVGCFAAAAHLSKSTDGGVTWTIPTPRSFEWTSFPVADPRDGTLYVIQSTATGMSAAVSKDGGSTWDERAAVSRSTPTDNLFVNGAIDAAGNVYMTWTDSDRGQNDVYMAYSTNKGQTWKGPFQVSSSVGTHIMPWIAAGGDGKVVISWYASPVKGDPNTLEADAKWYVTIAQSLNAHDAKPVFAESRVSPEAIHAGAVCTSGLSCTGDRDLADFFTVQIAPDGRAAVAYAHDGSGSTTKTLFALQNGGPHSR